MYKLRYTICVFCYLHRCLSILGCCQQPNLFIHFTDFIITYLQLALLTAKPNFTVRMVNYLLNCASSVYYLSNYMCYRRAVACYRPTITLYFMLHLPITTHKQHSISGCLFLSFPKLSAIPINLFATKYLKITSKKQPNDFLDRLFFV